MSELYDYENIAIVSNGRNPGSGVGPDEIITFRYQAHPEEATNSHSKQIEVSFEQSGFCVSLIEDGFVLGEIEIDDLRKVLEMRSAES